MTFPFYDYDSDFFSTEDLLFLAGASGKAVEATATGNPLTFTTDLARPLKSLLIPFTPVQSGTGDPSPQNVRPFVPWNGLKVYHSGADTSEYTETDISFPSPVYGGTPDIISGRMLVEYVAYDLGNVETWGKSSTGNKFYGTVPAYLYSEGNLFLCNKYKSDGIGNSERGYYGADGTIRYYYYHSLTAYEVYIRDDRFDNKEDFKQAIAGTYIVYPLAEPQTVTLTPEQITTLVGDNTIWSDANGQMTAVYLKKG